MAAQTYKHYSSCAGLPHWHSCTRRQTNYRNAQILPLILKYIVRLHLQLIKLHKSSALWQHIIVLS